MTIVHRLILTLTAALLGMLVIGFLGLMNLGQAQKRFEFVGSTTLPGFETLSEIEANLLRARTGIYQHVLNSDPARKATEEKGILDALGEVDRQLESYAAGRGSDEAGKQLVVTARNALQTYRKSASETIRLSSANDIAHAQQMLTGEIIKNGRTLSAALGELLRFNRKQADQIVKNNAEAYSSAFAFNATIMVVALAVSATLAFLLFKVIRQGLTSIEQTMHRVADDLDFSARAPLLRQDEIGQTAAAFNRLLDRLHSGFRSLTGDAQAVASAAQQLQAVAASVSHSATTQSDSSSSMAATIEEITVSVNHVAERASEAQQLSENSVELAQSGSHIISQTISDIRSISTVIHEAGTTIRELEAQSAQVGNIVQVIREVADQTNLLALNAAIEAARAGEAGRGFAVVADEVRKLAERTTSSTQEIAGTIASMRQQSERAAEHMLSVEQLVGQSEQRADDADQAIAKIGQSSSDTAGTVSEISGAIREQGVATNEIAVKVETIARMAEEASIAAQQAAQAAEQLAKQAAHQMATLSQYRL